MEINMASTIRRTPAIEAPITSERYTSREYLNKEWQKIWPKMWLVAGVASDVEEPGDYFVFNLEPESIIISRTSDNEVAAFYNVCQHRGARVLLSDRGAMEQYTCPYHGWTYANDGKLIDVPDEDRFSQGVPCEELSLKNVRVESWAGIIWVAMDPDGPGLDEFLGPIKEMVAPFRPEDMRLVEDQTVRLDCNWKAVYDNFSELYHVEHIHPQHELIFDCPASTSELLDNGHTRVLIDGFTVNSRLPIPDEVPATMWAQMKVLGMNKEDYKGRVLDIRRDVQLKKREMASSLGYNYDLLTDEQFSDIIQYNIFPNSILVLQPEEMWILRTRPHATDPDKCYWDKFALRMLPDKDIQDNAGVTFPALQNRANVSFNLEQTSDGLVRPEHDEFTQEDIISGEKTMTITIDQDVHLIRDVQKGMHSRGFSQAWLNDDESRVRHFHSWIDHVMES